LSTSDHQLQLEAEEIRRTLDRLGKYMLENSNTFDLALQLAFGQQVAEIAERFKADESLRRRVQRLGHQNFYLIVHLRSGLN